MLAACGRLLNGGEALPSIYNTNAPVNIGASGLKNLPDDSFTLWHGAGYGLLYSITEDKKYAELAYQCIEKCFAGQVDRDERYSVTTPGGQLRAGPVFVLSRLPTI